MIQLSFVLLSMEDKILTPKYKFWKSLYLNFQLNKIFHHFNSNLTGAWYLSHNLLGVHGSQGACKIVMVCIKLSHTIHSNCNWRGSEQASPKRANVNYFELKPIKTKLTQEKVYLTLNCLKNLGSEPGPERAIIRDNFLSGRPICMAEQTSKYQTSAFLIILWNSLFFWKPQAPIPLLNLGYLTCPCLSVFVGLRIYIIKLFFSSPG